jgi:hypothetical protein
MMLFATWGRSIHPDRLLIVEAAVRHLIEPQNLTESFKTLFVERSLCFAGLDRKYTYFIDTMCP